MFITFTITPEQDEIRKIKKATTLIAQGYRLSSCLFSRLPKEVAHKIAATVDHSLVNEKKALEVSRSHFFTSKEKAVEMANEFLATKMINFYEANYAK